ncbi:hypothetical protein MD484_g7397, partial [Candolleomyces efflorescens]
MDDAEDPWYPFEDEGGFRLADFLYREEEMSAKKIDYLLEIWALNKAKNDDLAPFNSYAEMYNAIDSIELGDSPWQSFSLNFADDRDNPADTPWKTASYEVWYRDPARVVSNILDNPDYDGQIDYAAYVEVNEKDQRCWSDFMSGNLAWRRSTQIYEDDPSTEGSMICPIILGSDKTTVSVATGHVEYHPLYLSVGNIHSTVRRAHRSSVIPIGFLAIPKSDRKYDNDAAFRKFKKELYHTSISRILQPLKAGMKVPVVQRCPDGHFRRVIYELAAFIADYPEQVALAGIVQGWCPRCTGVNRDLDGVSGPRTRALTKRFIESAKGDGTILWDSYGIDDDILPFTHDFLRADIHEMLSPDLLHQVIKGTFKDHLVTWVGEYLVLEHGEKRANEILDDIDRRIAAAPSFPGLRRFPHGRRFKQWTGDDSKALMKVYLPAIQGHVPDEMVQAISAFLDFCYIARRADFTEDTLKALDKALQLFYLHREIFRNTGVRPDGFSLPRQHSLSHYRHLIEEFGAPGGLCSSITESRHITAVKKPWRRSNRYEALGQMLLTNQRLDKLAAARVDFVRKGLLAPSRMLPLPVIDTVRQGQVLKDVDGEWEVVDDDVDFVQGNVTLARRHVRGRTYPKSLQELAVHVHQPDLPRLTRRFLYDQLNLGNRSDEEQEDEPPIPLDACPRITGPIRVFHSAVATFYAPSDNSGRRGMRRERIRSVPSWRKRGERRDCALIVVDESETGMRGMAVVQRRTSLLILLPSPSPPSTACERVDTTGRACNFAVVCAQVFQSVAGCNLAPCLQDGLRDMSSQLPSTPEAPIPVDAIPVDTPNHVSIAPIFPPTSIHLGLSESIPSPLSSNQLSNPVAFNLLLALAAQSLAASDPPDDEDGLKLDVDRAVGLDQAEEYRKKYKEANTKLRVTRLLLSASSSTSRLQDTLIDSLKRLLVQHDIEIPSQLASLTMAVRPLSLPSTT